MDIRTSKIGLVKMILDIENPALIIKINEMLKDQTGDFWLSLSDQEIEEIEFAWNN